MSMRGSCNCNNFEILWRTVDYSVVPRACQCEYCLARGAAYVSKSGTAIEVRVRNDNLHRIVTHGTGSAGFHECAGCGDLVLVTAAIGNELYGALNAGCMDNKLGFSEPVQTHFVSQTVAQRRERWRQNWCCPVRITASSNETA